MKYKLVKIPSLTADIEKPIYFDQQMDNLYNANKVDIDIMKKTIIPLLILLFLLPTISPAGWFGPSNYDDCILESMKGIQSDIAARLIYKSCRQKFPEATTSLSEPSSQSKNTPRPPQKKITKTTRLLPRSTTSKLTGTANIQTGLLSGNVHNGSNYWTITDIIVSLHNNNAENAPINTKKYGIKIKIIPHSSATFNVTTSWTKGENDSWAIESAFGYHAKQSTN